MSTSNQSYKKLAIPYFKEVFEIIDEIMQKHKISYYLIGVNAIALELLKEGIKPSRGTKDIDFAVMISSGEDYKKITKDLEEKNFTKVKAPWTGGVYRRKISANSSAPGNDYFKTGSLE